MPLRLALRRASSPPWPIVSALGLALSTLTLTLALATPAAAGPRLVVWAWERPEDLRFLPPGVEIAAQTGFVLLSGDQVLSRGRRFALRTDRPPSTALVHVEIDPRRPLAWTPEQRAAAASAALSLARQPWARRVQIDFEVRRSQRQALLDLLGDVRRGLATGTPLSMTAIASWCETEDWLRGAPVDEIVPMLFRMGPRGAALEARLAAGGDFAEPECRRALAVSADNPLPRAPTDRTLYLFDPKSWRPQDFQRLREEIDRWAGAGR